MNKILMFIAGVIFALGLRSLVTGVTAGMHRTSILLDLAMMAIGVLGGWVITELADTDQPNGS